MTAGKKRALGRGLEELLPIASVHTNAGASYGEKSVFSCPIERLHAQQGQPRQRIDDARLQELADSLREHGLIEPLVVRRSPTAADQFEIIAGERRWRAAQRAGITELLVVVKDVTPRSAFELALIENLQREDLDPIEVAEAIDRLIQEHDYTHEMVASRLHKDRTTITNALRLLRLPASVRAYVVEGKLSEGHARALLGIASPEVMEQLANKAVRGKLSVRTVESLVREQRQKERDKQATDTAATETTQSANVRALETQLSHHFGRQVRVRDRHGKGEVVIAYNDLDDLDNLLGLLGLD